MNLTFITSLIALQPHCISFYNQYFYIDLCFITDDIGTFCRQAGVTLHKLKSDDPCILEEPLCNGAALEILNLMNDGFFQGDVYLMFKKIYKDNPKWNEPSKTALLLALHRVFFLPKKSASKDGSSETKGRRKHECEQCSCLETNVLARIW